MSTTKPRPPMVSDERINDPELTIPLGAKMVRDHYEATWGPLIQQLVDLTAQLRCKEGCRKYEAGGTAPLCFQCGERHRILAAASQHGFTPS